MQIYVHRAGQQLGPFTEAEIKAQLAGGTISPQDLVWWEGQAGWVPLGQSSLVPNLGSAFPPPVAFSPPPTLAGSGERTSGLAIASLVSGIASFVFGLTFIVAIILGHLSLSEIRRNPGMKGRGMAIAGLILGYLVPAIFLVVIVAISVLLAVGNPVKSTFKTIDSQLEMEQTNSVPAISDSSTVTNNANQTAPDSNTNAAPQSTGH